MSAFMVNVEGTDGSGKETQCKKLLKYFEKRGYKTKMISFPMYDNESSTFVKKYLNGEYGKVNDNIINEYGASVLFTLDRYISFITDWKKIYDTYDVIILDRYVESNIIYQAAKMTNIDDIINYVRWELDFEYNKLKLPKPDITFFLNMPPEASTLLRKGRKNKITNGDTQDIHESDSNYLMKVYQTASLLYQSCSWVKIDCVKSPYVKNKKEICTPDEILEKITSYIEQTCAII